MNMAGNYRYTEDDACPASLCSVNLVNLIEDPVEPEVSRAISRETQVSIPNLDELTLVPSVSLGNIQEQKKEYFDIAMLYDDADIHRVRTLADILKKFIFCNGEESLSICCDHNDLQNAVGQLTVVNYERKLESSYCYFVFFSKKPRETAFWTQFQNYCALDHRLKNPDIHQLVPVVTGKDVKPGISFNGIQPVVISELLIRHRSLDEVVVDRLTDKDVNMKIVNGIAAVLKEGREKNSSKDNGNAVLSNSNDRYTVSIPQPTTQC